MLSEENFFLFCLYIPTHSKQKFDISQKKQINMIVNTSIYREKITIKVIGDWNGTCHTPQIYRTFKFHLRRTRYRV